MNHLEKFGFVGRFADQAAGYPGLNAARVISQHRDLYKVITENGEQLAEVSGKFQYEAMDVSDYPVTGDFVMLDNSHGQNSHAIIHLVLNRKSTFERVAAGKGAQTQIIAANIDVIFICMSLNRDYNLSRLERFLAAAWNCSATPVVVLTKSDLCENLDQLLAEASGVAAGTDVIAVSKQDESSYCQLLDYLQKGKTASFIGSSGVGKSTLINCLAGEQLLATAEIRQDGKGRHTSTSRELLLLPNGGVVIDTPGMREFGVESVDLSHSFGDIEELISRCRFSDCTHNSEPGCAVREAIENGDIDHRRLESYQKLQKEARYVGLDAKELEKVKLNDMFKEVGGMKNVRKFNKLKDKRKYDDHI